MPEQQICTELRGGYSTFYFGYPDKNLNTDRRSKRRIYLNKSGRMVSLAPFLPQLHSECITTLLLITPTLLATVK